MLLIRDIYHCKPGKVRSMVEKFKQMAPLGEAAGMRKPRILTDLSGERFWTVICEMEVESLEQWMAMGEDGAEMARMEAIMKGYHDLVEEGRREIYTIEE